MTDNPFLAGQFVWCSFPVRERPSTPGPRHIGYVLVTVKDAHGHGAMVAYTTSQPWSGRTPRGVRSFTREQATDLGQARAFMLDLRRIAYIPVDAAWFPDVNGTHHGIVGRAPEKLRLDLEETAKELFGRHAGNIEKLGSRWP